MSESTSLIRHTELPDIEGRKIRKVIESPSGKYGYLLSLVIVFDDNSWFAVSAIADTSENAFLRFTEGNATGRPITDYLTAEELLEVGLINTAQFRYLAKQEIEKDKAIKRERLALIRAEADRLARKIEQLEKETA